MDYYAICDEMNDESAVIEAFPEDCPADWRFHEGESLIGEFPSGARMKMSSNYPDGRILGDVVSNTLGLLIVSQRMQGLLIEASIPNVEMLPVDIEDHRGDITGPGYAILNSLRFEAIIDLEKSDYKMSNLDKDKIKRIKNLVVDHAAISEDANLFRASMRKRQLFLRADLLDQFREAEMTGYAVYAAEGWDGLKI